MNTSYRYSAENRILKPCHYMYTQFVGERLFKDFFSSRKSCRTSLENMVLGCQNMVPLNKKIFDSGLSQLVQTIEKLEPKLVSRLKTSFPLSELQEQADNCINYLPGEELKQLSKSRYVDSDIDTMELLLSLLNAITNEAMSQELQVKEWLNRLVQRFEVAKKLYTGYPLGSRKGSGEYDQIIIYALFAFLLSLYYGKGGNIRYLNTLIKLNDLICSVLESAMQDQVTCTAAYFALAHEAIYVGELLQRKGLNQCILLT